ncbi:hypothetical protein [Microcoleus sp. FACHB-672]|uniref:hypothetical protein n=1 Tax=Microcoleus sp. FACHB-672 TaxID=2692825 RepID=UPI001683D56A|nr:hypothetical protein [Microcoleus sp. FACHB-672]MBD2040213.1 hypothetical protein [Microcoleus sp. FACHB-672]
MQKQLNENPSKTDGSRKNLINSLLTGLIVGIIAGAPLGWFVHQYYAEQRLAQILICREKHRNQPEERVLAICGSRF